MTEHTEQVVKELSILLPLDKLTDQELADDLRVVSMLIMTLHAEQRRRHSLPPLTAQIANAAEAVKRVANAVMKQKPILVEADEYERRRSICSTCPLWVEASKRCTKCGCKTEAKTRLATEHCPEGKW